VRRRRYVEPAVEGECNDEVSDAKSRNVKRVSQCRTKRENAGEHSKRVTMWQCEDLRLAERREDNSECFDAPCPGQYCSRLPRHVLFIGRHETVPD
jgi:hypothetical protein